MEVFVLAALVLGVALAAWRTRGNPTIARGCCQNGPWPPDDLTAEPARPPTPR